MKNIFKLMKRELDKVFKDPRVIFTTIILPGVVLFLMYTMFGIASKGTSSNINDHTSVIQVYGDISVLDSVWEISQAKVDIIQSEALPDEQEIESKLQNSEINLFLISEGLVDGKLKIKVYADTSDTLSSAALSRLSTVLNVYQQIQLELEGVDVSRYSITEMVDYAKADGISIMIFSMMLPMMIVIMLFANSMSISSESITGEKERGTLATLIMTPIKRSDIIFAKVLSNTVISLLTALSSFVGMLFSMDSLTEMIGTGGSVAYTIGDYLCLLIPILCIALLSVSLFSIAGTVSKTVKEANALSLPLYICGIVCSIIAAYQNAPTEWFYYLIPIYNCTACMKSIFSFSLEPLNLILSAASSVVFFLLISLFLSRLFKSEKVLFSY